MPSTTTPSGIDSSRHQDLAGRSRHVWLRRAALLVVAAVPVLGLVNTFGQRTEVRAARGPAAALEVKSPERLRGGLTFTTKILITPHRDLKDGQLYLDRGWFANMTFNGVSPQPSNQDAQGNWQIWDFGPMSSGVAFTVWISWQANPTNTGHHSQVVELYDGDTELLSVNHSVFIFP